MTFRGENPVSVPESPRCACRIAKTRGRFPGTVTTTSLPYAVHGQYGVLQIFTYQEDEAESFCGEGDNHRPPLCIVYCPPLCTVYCPPLCTECSRVSHFVLSRGTEPSVLSVRVLWRMHHAAGLTQAGSTARLLLKGSALWSQFRDCSHHTREFHDCQDYDCSHLTREFHDCQDYD